jgi:hypothetical protein
MECRTMNDHHRSEEKSSSSAAAAAAAARLRLLFPGGAEYVTLLFTADVVTGMQAGGRVPDAPADAPAAADGSPFQCVPASERSSCRFLFTR